MDIRPISLNISDVNRKYNYKNLQVVEYPHTQAFHDNIVMASKEPTRRFDKFRNLDNFEAGMIESALVVHIIQVVAFFQGRLWAMVNTRVILVKGKRYKREAGRVLKSKGKYRPCNTTEIPWRRTKFDTRCF